MASVSAAAFWTSKAGNAEAEWEDHFCLDEHNGRFALADGASSSPRAAAWATELTEGFIDDPFDLGVTDEFDRWIATRAKQLDATRSTRADDEVTAENWYALASEEKAGFATLIAMSVDHHPDTDDVGFEFLGVGDACLFHTHERTLTQMAPAGAGDFDSFPDLVSTLSEHRSHALDRAFRGGGRAVVGDEIFLMSDAFAEWSIGVGQRDPEIWSLLSELDHLTFRRLVDDLRTNNEIVNDDVTVIRCRVIG